MGHQLNRWGGGIYKYWLFARLAACPAFQSGRLAKFFCEDGEAAIVMAGFAVPKEPGMPYTEKPETAHDDDPGHPDAVP